MSSEQILETFTRSDCEQRILVVRRPDGIVTYRLQLANGQSWEPPGPECGLYDSRETAVAEAKKRVWWLALEAGLKPEFGPCSFCRQGKLEAWANLSSGQVVLICDDCEAQWPDPDSIYTDAPLVDEVADVEPASTEQMIEGWNGMTAGASRS